MLVRQAVVVSTTHALCSKQLRNLKVITWLLRLKYPFLDEWFGVCYNNVMWFLYEDEEYMVKYTEVQRKRAGLPRVDGPTVTQGRVQVCRNFWLWNYPTTRKASFELYRSLDEDTKGEMIAKNIKRYNKPRASAKEVKGAKLPKRADWPKYRIGHSGRSDIKSFCRFNSSSIKPKGRFFLMITFFLTFDSD